MSKSASKDPLRLSLETGAHLNTVRKWLKAPESVNPAVAYALTTAAAKLGLKLPKGAVDDVAEAR